jgi:hypothetical protein
MSVYAGKLEGEYLKLTVKKWKEDEKYCVINSFSPNSVRVITGHVAIMRDKRNE